MVCTLKMDGCLGTLALNQASCGKAHSSQVPVLALPPYCCAIWYTTSSLWAWTSHLYSQGPDQMILTFSSSFRVEWLIDVWVSNGFREEGAKFRETRNCIWIWSIQGFEVQELGWNHPPTHLTILPPIHPSVHPSSRYCYNSHKEFNTT